MRVVGVLLAAGRGARFGGDKLLAPLSDGTPLGVRTARNLKAALPEVVAVVRPEDEALQRLLAAEGVRVEPCDRAWEGMGASLAHAVAATREAGGWVVALADMPMIAPATIRAVAAALEAGAPIAAPFFRGSRGHPVGFGAVHGARLATLSGDAGARDILRIERASIREVASDDPGILADIDTPDELARLAGRAEADDGS